MPRGQQDSRGVLEMRLIRAVRTYEGKGDQNRGQKLGALGGVLGPRGLKGGSRVAVNSCCEGR